MQVQGRLVNAASPDKNDVFDGYAVEIRYLVPAQAGEAPVYQEIFDRFVCRGKDNAFAFELPDAHRIALDKDIQISVRNRSQSIVLSQSSPIATLLRSEKPLELMIAKIEPPPASTPLSLRGRLVWREDQDRTEGFDGFRVDANFRARDPELAVTSYAPRSASAMLASTNAFEIALPDREELDQEPLEVVVKYPDGQHAAAERYSLTRIKEPVVIEIALQQRIVVKSDGRVQDAKREKLKGKVVDLDGRVQVSNRQVIVWGKHADGTTKPVAVATTDAHGNFGADRPNQRFSGAAATVSGTRNARTEDGLPVEVVDQTDGSPLGLLPKFMYLVVTLAPADASGDEDCACDSPTPRLPDAEDLVNNSDAYSQDIGLNCVNFTTPNRTLEEFTYTLVVRTTDPDIKGTTLSDLDRRAGSERKLRALVATDYALEQASPAARAAQSLSVPSLGTALRNVLSSKITAEAHAQPVASQMAALPAMLRDHWKAVPGRGVLNAGNSVDWDGTPTFYQATTIAHGHLLHFKQIWKADGYSLGDLLYSLPLAPGQKKQIVIFDWDRTEYGRRDEDKHEDEALSSYLGHNRDVMDIARGSLAEHAKGGSHSETSGSAGGVGAGVGALIGPVMIGVAGGFSTSSGSADSSAWQDSSRDVAATGLNQLRDMVQQGASAVRNQRSTVVQTARQSERFKVETEVVANHNHCHAVTMQYFEVLRHYAIEQKISHVQECLFIPLLMSEFDIPKLVRWQDTLRRVLLLPPRRGPLSLFGAHPLVRGIDAAERIFLNYEGSDFPADAYASESLVSFSGELTITFQLNRPLDDDDNADDPARQEQLITVATLAGAPGWAIWWPLVGNANYVFGQYFANQKVKYKNRIFEERVAPVLAAAVIDQLVFTAVSAAGVRVPLSADTTMVSNYQRDVQLFVTVRPVGPVNIRRDQITFVEIGTSVDLSSSERSKIIVNDATFRYSTPHLDGYLARNYRADNDLKPNDPVVIYTPLSAEEKRKPRQEDKQFSNMLLEHLNSNLEYYHKAIWQRMDPDRRYMLLDGFVAPNANGKSVASVVENRVIGVAGNSLIMPVAPGYKLDPTYEYQPQLDDEGQPLRDERENILYEPTSLLEHYQPLTPIPPFRVSVPTRGVFGESIMGACNACEKKDETRFWRWEESPNPDEPTPINPIQTQSPQRTDPGDLKAEPFPTPMINIQNAPPAPEPGATLTGALGLLGKSDVFRDLTGLEQTQKNALQAMLSNQESAKHFADTAAQLAIQAANLKSGNTTVESIKKSMADGTLDQTAGKKLIEDTYRAQIGGKMSADNPGNTASMSDLGKAAAQSVKEGKSVKATQTHPDGTSTSVDQSVSSPSKPGGTAGGGPMLSFAVDAGDAGGGGGAAALIHAPGISDAVAAFKSVFSATPELLSRGQFQITSAVFVRMKEVVDADLAARPDPELQGIWDEMLRGLNGRRFESDDLINKVKSRGLQASYPGIMQAYGPDATATKAWAQDLYGKIWSGDAIKPIPSVDPPSLKRADTARTLGGVDLNGKPTGENGACHNSTHALGRKYIKAKALPPIPATLKISQGQIAGAHVVTKNATEGFDLIAYASPTSLAKVVDAMKRALDAGYPIVCGVLSGARHDMAAFPTPEHFLLVYAYENNIFAFWDSDSAVTKLEFTGWGPGFGFLVATTDALSTGFDAADNVAVDGGGNHVQFPNRHRYQVYSVQTLPA